LARAEIGRVRWWCQSQRKRLGVTMDFGAAVLPWARRKCLARQICNPGLATAYRPGHDHLRHKRLRLLAVFRIDR